jgi:dipeptidyl aminopeptidase/acylaminoacyl peptidase
MSTFDRIERRMPELMSELAPEAVPDYFDDLLGRTRRARQRPAWASPEGWLPMDVVARPVHARAPALRPLLVLLLIGLLVAAGVMIYAGMHRTTVPEPFRNGSVVFEYDSEVFIADQLGGTPRQLVGGWNPVFSPLGDRVAFTQEGPSSGIEVLTVRPDGTDITKLGAELITLSVQLDWAPDGSALLANGLGIRDRRSIHLIATDGSGSWMEIDGPDAEVGQGAWRPDGRHIAFLASSGVFIANADGANVRPLEVGTVEPDGELAWSPDGTQLAFTSRQNGANNARVSIADVDAAGAVTGLRQLPLDEELSADSTPTWSPDGASISLLLRPEPLPERGAVSSQVGIFESDGSGYRIVGPAVPIESGKVVWSPDGRSLVVQGDFWRWKDRTFAGDLWSVDVQTGEVTEIATPVDSWQRLAP